MVTAFTGASLLKVILPEAFTSRSNSSASIVSVATMLLSIHHLRADIGKLINSSIALLLQIQLLKPSRPFPPSTSVVNGLGYLILLLPLPSARHLFWFNFEIAICIQCIEKAILKRTRFQIAFAFDAVRVKYRLRAG